MYIKKYKMLTYLDMLKKAWHQKVKTKLNTCNIIQNRVVNLFPKVNSSYD